MSHIRIYRAGSEDCPRAASLARMLQCPRAIGRRVCMSQETSGLEQRGVEIVPKDERTVGFWDLFIIWGGFSIIMTNFLLGALGISIGIGPAIFAHMIGILK